MKLPILIILCIILNTEDLISQTNDSLNCAIHELYIGPIPKIYENKTDTVFKFHFEEFNVVQNLLINTTAMESYIKIDSVWSQNPFDKIITKNDKPISLDDFVPIRLSKLQGDAHEILFEYHIDFVGDELADKIQIKVSELVSNRTGKSPLYLDLYENIDGNFINYTSCGNNFWDKPLKFYVSETKKMGMSMLMFIVESDIPEESMKMLAIHADVFR